MRLTPRGAGTLLGGALVFVVGAVLGLRPATVLGAIAVGLVVIGALAVFERPGLIVRRLAAPPDVQRGESASVTLMLHSTARRRRPMTIIESVGGHRRSHRITALGPEGATITYPVDTTHRGVVVAGPLEAQRSDPFGLLLATRRVGGTCSVQVRPRLHSLRMLPSGRQRDLEGPTRERSEGTASFHQIRPYHEGDDLRRVHWRTTARTATLMVKQMVDTTRPELVVVLDNRSTAMPPTDFEEAVDIAASLLHAADQEDFPSTLRLGDGSEDLVRAVNGQPLPHLDVLTAVEQRPTDGLLQLGERIVARGRSLVFVTGELGGADLRAVGLIANGFQPAYLVSVVGHRHAPLVAPPGMRAVACSSAANFAVQWSAVW